MNKFAVSGLVLLLSTAAHAATSSVTMKSISFDPKKIEIKVNDSVEWTNKSYTEHSATSNDAGGFDTGLVKPNTTSKKIEFKKAGTFPYHCSIHGKTMSGEVVVQP